MSKSQELLINDANYILTLRDQHDKYFNSLEQEDREAIYDYSDNSYEEVNYFLRNHKFSEEMPENYQKDVLDLIERINRVISGAPHLTQPIIVYRGVSNDNILEVIPKLEVGKTIDLFKYGFNSCSFDPLIAHEFSQSENRSNCCMFALYLPSGTEGLYLGLNSTRRREDEFILGANPNFRAFKFPDESFPTRYDPTQDLIRRKESIKNPIMVNLYRLACNDFNPV